MQADLPDGARPGPATRDVDMYNDLRRSNRQLPAIVTLLVAVLLGAMIGGAASYTLRVVNM